jgi:hypothetical protein
MREQAIADESPIRSWSDIFNDVYASVMTPAQRAGDTPRVDHRRMRLGEIYRLRNRAARKNPMSVALAEAARVGTGWHVLEEWGAWTAQKTFQMEFRVAGLDTLPVPIDGKRPDVFLFVALRGQKEATKLRVEANDLPTEIVDVPADINSVIRIELRSDQVEDGRIHLVMTQNVLTDLAEHAGGVDSRLVGIGVRSFMVCSAQDMISRVEFLEEEGANYRIVSADGSAV